jgi:ornithine carbamoyltransferase
MDLSLPRRAGLKGRDLITLADYDQETLYFLLETAQELKRAQARGAPHRVLEGKSLGMLFAKPSTRTRISFEAGMTQLGGHAQFYTADMLQLTNKETWVDTARTMDRYLDGIAIRLYNVEPYGESRRVLSTIASAARVPVINMLDDGEHPCQVLADVMTVFEKLRTLENKKIVLSWAYSMREKSPGVPNGWLMAASILGFDLTLAYPQDFDLDPEYVGKAKRFSAASGAKIEIVHDIKEAARDAHIFYCKSWGSLTLPWAEVQKRDKELRQWIVTDELLDLGVPTVKFMHPLPADRGLEVTDAVIDGPHAIVYDQLENRLHAQKAVLALTL